MPKIEQSNLNTRPKLLIAAVLALIATYIFASLAIDTAKYLYYILAIVSFVLSIKYFVRTLKPHGKN